MKKLYFAISVIILIFVVYISFQTLAGKGKISSANNIPGQILVEKEETNIELLVSGTFNYNSSYNHSEPALIHINPNNDFSINIIDLKKFNLYYYGLHEVRPIMINNEHKIVLGTYTLNASYKKPKLIILDKSNGFDNLQMEFEEEIDDERIRAVFVEDIDNDGEKEIVIGTRPNGILKYYKFANNQWTGFQLDFINATIHDILVEDINSNNRKEIITT
ncbi:MAG: hypothetical protein QF864_10320, partial [SAR202 cluster bacterium]|nr:hypothetical protein [SAR202 cluster bacterium]